MEKLDYYIMSVFHEDKDGEKKWHFFGSCFSKYSVSSLMEEALNNLPEDAPVRIRYGKPNEDSLSPYIFVRRGDE